MSESRSGDRRQQRRKARRRRNQYIGAVEKGSGGRERGSESELLAIALVCRCTANPERQPGDRYPTALLPVRRDAVAPPRLRIMRMGRDHLHLMTLSMQTARQCASDDSYAGRLGVEVVAPELNPHRKAAFNQYPPLTSSSPVAGFQPGKLRIPPPPLTPLFSAAVGSRNRDRNGGLLGRLKQRRLAVIPGRRREDGQRRGGGTGTARLRQVTARLGGATRSRSTSEPPRSGTRDEPAE